MTNGEKIKAIFPNTQIDEGMLEMYVWLDHEPAQFTKDWWNAEYNEPTTKNLCDSCGNSTNCMMQSGIVRKECGLYKPTSENDLGVDCTPNTISFKEAMDILRITAEDIENAEDLEYSIEPLILPKNDLGVDAVSRQFMRELGATCIATRDKNNKLIALGALDELPSVTPQEPKRGHWIKVHPLQENDEGDYMCSECRCGGLVWKPTTYCPNCGCRMVEPQESEE